MLNSHRARHAENRTRRGLAVAAMAILGCILFMCGRVDAQYPWAQQKKLIFWGDLSVGPAWFKSNQTTAEQSPFDGMIIAPSNSTTNGGLNAAPIFNPDWNTLDTISLKGTVWKESGDGLSLVSYRLIPAAALTCPTARRVAIPR